MSPFKLSFGAQKLSDEISQSPTGIRNLNDTRLNFIIDAKQKRE